MGDMKHAVVDVDATLEFFLCTEVENVGGVGA